jgi:hypothetical protein
VGYTGSKAGKKGSSKDDGLPWYAWVGIALVAGGAGYGIYRGGKALIGWWKNRPPKGPDEPPDYPGIEDAAIDGADMQAVFTRLAHEQMDGDTSDARINLAVDELFIALNREGGEEIKPEEAGEALASFESAEAFKAFLVGEKGAGGMGIAEDDRRVAKLVTLWQMQEAHKPTSEMNWEKLDEVSDLMFTYASSHGQSMPKISFDDNAKALIELVAHQIEHGHPELHDMAMLAHLGRYAADVGAGEYAKSLSARIMDVKDGKYTDVAKFLSQDAPDEMKEAAVVTMRAAIASSLMMRAHDATGAEDDSAGYCKNAAQGAQVALRGIKKIGLPNDFPLAKHVSGIMTRANTIIKPAASGFGTFA